MRSEYTESTYQLHSISVLKTIFCSFSWRFSSRLKVQSSADFARFLDNVKSNTPAEEQKVAALEVINRLIPERAHEFTVEINTSLPISFKISKRSEDDKVSITASSGITACKGFYHYLKYYCGCHVSWNEDQLALPEILPLVQLSRTSPSRFVYYQNVCTWSYSFASWTWFEWRRHIDWMALNGITLSLAPVQESIWTEIYRELGLTQKEIDEHIAGPAFLAWQRMGNIRGVGGPLPDTFKDRLDLLQKQVVCEIRRLGGIVALPAFAGHVPVALKRLFPQASFTPVERWNRFSDEECCPLFLEPSDALFQTIGENFLSKVTEQYGSDHIYFADPFNEIQPAEANGDYLKKSAQGIFSAMKTVDDKAVWLLQGWMFVKNPFWSDELLESFLTAIPRGRFLVLDLMSEQYPQYERTNSYYGQPFIWCMLHNFGGTLGMHGSVNNVNVLVPSARERVNSTMVGVGVAPEGIWQNHVMYEFALEMAWNYDSVDEEAWFFRYSTSRYGIVDGQAVDGWEELRNSVYAYKGLDKINGKYTYCRRPSLKLSPWIWYERAMIERAWENFINASEALKTSKLFLRDLVDVTRQALQNRADEIYLVIIQAYNHQQTIAVERMSAQFLDLLADIERILRSDEHFLLGRWIESFKAMGRTDAERHLYEMNARNQVTLWGSSGEIVDYATKQWSGIIEDYFIPRWKVFFDEMITAMKRNSTINNNQVQEKIFKTIEVPFTLDTKIYPVTSEGDSLAISTELYDKWADLRLNIVVPREKPKRMRRRNRKTN
ncbi:alpha-N-acetylglucosaminidase [Phlebotomus argentipes]|uniref:alpha-N-acetylglucosaminidase n=1 Tax=Phlebotomus argentipes TaxID=94469 RepID=UPI002892D6CB|nr:alpha-N-acetylglucosaminidase [Phlebotomus argentipes]